MGWPATRSHVSPRSCNYSGFHGAHFPDRIHRVEPAFLGEALPLFASKNTEFCQFL